MSATIKTALNPKGRNPPGKPSRGLHLLALIALLVPYLATTWYFGRNDDGWLPPVVYGACKLFYLVFPLLYWWRVRAEGVSIRRPEAREWTWGLGAGLVMLAVILAGYFGLLRDHEMLVAVPGLVAEKISGFGLLNPGLFLAFAAFVVVINAFLEEYFWRWFAFSMMKQALPWLLAAVLSGLLFALHHYAVLVHYFPPEWHLKGAVGMSAVIGFAGIVWALLYQKTQSFYVLFISHAVADVAVFLVAYDLLRDHWVS
jgi:membrane protease YdiL (CAAX protease family)